MICRHQQQCNGQQTQRDSLDTNKILQSCGKHVLARGLGSIVRGAERVVERPYHHTSICFSAKTGTPPLYLHISLNLSLRQHILWL